LLLVFLPRSKINSKAIRVDGAANLSRQKIDEVLERWRAFGRVALMESRKTFRFIILF
jgi:hypothetical protein